MRSEGFEEAFLDGCGYLDGNTVFGNADLEFGRDGWAAGSDTQ